MIACVAGALPLLAGAAHADPGPGAGVDRPAAPQPPGPAAPAQLPSPRGAPRPLATPSCPAKPVGPLQYLYAGAYQYVASSGTQAYLDQHQPCVASSDSHSLAEITAQSADGRQIVEVGWTVDRQLNGDAKPHLFVYHWVNGKGSCYNGCGFVLTSTTQRPGMAVSVTTTAQRYAIRFYHGNWWIGFRSEWIGYFPGSLWKNTFTSSGLTFMFGEVAATSAKTCTDMGAGVAAGSAGAAQVRSISYFDTTATPAIQLYPVGPYYSVHKSGPGSFSYGGAGAC